MYKMRRKSLDCAVPMPREDTQAQCPDWALTSAGMRRLLGRHGMMARQNRIRLRGCLSLANSLSCICRELSLGLYMACSRLGLASSSVAPAPVGTGRLAWAGPSTGKSRGSRLELSV